MKDDADITFTFEGIGQVAIPVTQCRALCPQETAAFEAIADKMSAAVERGDIIEMTMLHDDFGDAFGALEEKIKGQRAALGLTE